MAGKFSRHTIDMEVQATIEKELGCMNPYLVSSFIHADPKRASTWEIKAAGYRLFFEHLIGVGNGRILKINHIRSLKASDKGE